jgi:nicotinic acid phosphoribosyltransferase
MDYKNKYLKYKYKYENLLKIIGGTQSQSQTLYNAFEQEFRSRESTLSAGFVTWVGEHMGDIGLILNRFKPDGESIKPLSATTFSDYYKWTMAPVIDKIAQVENPIVTFGIDLREQRHKELLVLPQGAELKAQIEKNLRTLAERRFEPQVFDAVFGHNPNLNRDRDMGIFKEIIYKQSGSAGSAPEVNTLADEVILTKYEVPSNRGDPNRNKVVISSFIGPDNTFEDKRNKYYIEITGPWKRVSWLETSVMQCVYETLLKHELNLARKSYALWLVEALDRCYKSVEFANQIPIPGALFSGRRTGGFAFMLLQIYLMSDQYHRGKRFPQLLPDGTKPMVSPVYGTSSVDGWFVLGRLEINKEHLLKPVGTHAHELSMVLGALYRQRDLYSELPLSQLLGHFMYWKETAQAHLKDATSPLSKIPALPDTLGTGAFLRAGDAVMFKGEGERKRFLDKLIGPFRQDSGELGDFIDLLNGKYKFSHPAGVMASEIDTRDTLTRALELGFKSYGAGGFFGDSEKVWNFDANTINMAVKPVRVINCAGQILYPIKCGDRKTPLDITGTDRAKLSVDTGAPKPEILQAIEYANTLWGEGRKERIDDIINKQLVTEKFKQLLQRIYGTEFDGLF